MHASVRFIVLISAFIVPLRAGLLLTVQSSQVGIVGTTLEFSGSLSNIGDQTLYLNGTGVQFPAIDITFDDSPFFAFVPPILNAGDRYTGLLFYAIIDSMAIPNDYFGAVTIFGGIDPVALDALGTQNFSISVTNVPEPSAKLLGTLGIFVICVYRWFQSSRRAFRAFHPTQ